MNLPKPRLAIVCSYKTSCTNAYYADALIHFLESAFEVEVLDLRSFQLLRLEGSLYYQKSEAYLNELCQKLQQFDIVNVHLELGLFGTRIEDMTRRIQKICQASKRLILTMHRLDVDDGEHAQSYAAILQSLKNRPSSNPFHVIVHLPRERTIIEEMYSIKNISDFPVIFLTDKRREHFQQMRNPNVWKKQFGLSDNDITIGFFGLLNPYKNYSHALKTLKLLPSHYKLLIVGEAPPAGIKTWQVDPTIQEILSYLDNNPTLQDRVIFTGRRDDSQFNEDLANIDFVLIPYFEVGQSASASLSNALEVCCPILMSKTFNCREYEMYFPDCFETFDIGNYYETKNKILNFNRKKTQNLKVRLSQY
ncbi:MAG: glycosyltransferase, partial [Rhabdochlamydiaceae bacterium]